LSDAYLIHNLKIVYGKDGLTWDELKQVPASQCQVYHFQMLVINLHFMNLFKISLIVEDDIIEK
jgi:hypothetical protein